jgi:hypothetical protein
MAKDYIMLLTLNLFVMFGVLYASSVEQLTKESTDAFAAIKKAAQILSVSSPGKIFFYILLII